MEMKRVNAANLPSARTRERMLRVELSTGAIIRRRTEVAKLLRGLSSSDNSGDQRPPGVMATRPTSTFKKRPHTPQVRPGRHERRPLSGCKAGPHGQFQHRDRRFGLFVLPAGG
jgi:hypothetical protein